MTPINSNIINNAIKIKNKLQIKQIILSQIEYECNKLFFIQIRSNNLFISNK
jgi:hypothetical protein